MKYTTALIALAAAVSAQDITIFPTCSLSCIVSAVGSTTSCGSDFECVCKEMEAVKAAALPCVTEKCGEDVTNNEVLPATEEFCSSFTGGDDEESSSSVEETPAPTTTAEETGAPTTSAAEEPTETADDGEDDEEEDGEEPSSTGSNIPTPTGEPTPTDDAPEPTGSEPVEAGAARLMGGLGMVLLGAVAAL